MNYSIKLLLHIVLFAMLIITGNSFSMEKKGNLKPNENDHFLMPRMFLLLGENFHITSLNNIKEEEFALFVEQDKLYCKTYNKDRIEIPVGNEPTNTTDKGLPTIIHDKIKSTLIDKIKDVEAFQFGLYMAERNAPIATKHYEDAYEGIGGNELCAVFDFISKRGYLPYNAKLSINEISPTMKHWNFICSWLPTSATQALDKLEFIYARWAFSQMGPNEMAVSEVLVPSRSFLTLAGVGFLEGVEDLIAEEKGKYKFKESEGKTDEAEIHLREIGKIVQNANLMGITVGLPVALGMRSFYPIMISNGYNPVLYEPLHGYYQMLSLGVPMRHLCFISRNFLVAEGFFKNALLISGLSIFTSGLNYLFIRSPLRFDNVFKGMAAASIIESAISAGGYLSMYYLQDDFKKYQIYNVNIDTRLLLKICKRGLPMYVKRLLGAINPFILTSLVVPDQPDALSTLSLINQIFLPSNIINASIAKSTNISIKNSTGGRITQKAFDSGMVSLQQSQIIAGIFALTFYLYPNALASLFVDLADVKNQALLPNYRSVVGLQSLNYFVSSLVSCTTAALRGIGQLSNSTYPEILSSWCIGLPLSYYLAQSCDYGIQGVIMGSLVANIFLSLYLQYHWWSSYFTSEETASKKYV